MQAQCNLDTFSFEVCQMVNEYVKIKLPFKLVPEFDIIL